MLSVDNLQEVAHILQMPCSCTQNDQQSFLLHYSFTIVKPSGRTYPISLANASQQSIGKGNLCPKHEIFGVVDVDHSNFYVKLAVLSALGWFPAVDVTVYPVYDDNNASHDKQVLLNKSKIIFNIENDFIWESDIISARVGLHAYLKGIIVMVALSKDVANVMECNIHMNIAEKCRLPWMENMIAMKEQQVFTDVTFKFPEGEELHAHSQILAAASGYFLTLFTSGTSESISHVIDIPDSLEREFNFFLEFLS